MIPVLCGHCGQRVIAERAGPAGRFTVPAHGSCTGPRTTLGHRPITEEARR